MSLPDRTGQVWEYEDGDVCLVLAPGYLDGLERTLRHPAVWLIVRSREYGLRPYVRSAPLEDHPGAWERDGRMTRLV